MQILQKTAEIPMVQVVYEFVDVSLGWNYRYPDFWKLG